MERSGFDAERLAEHREAQAATGWPLLASCPSTGAVAALANLTAIDPADRAGFAQQFNALDAGQADASPVVARYLAGNAERGPSGLGRIPVKITAGVAKDSAIGGIEGWLRQMGLAGDAALPPPTLAAGIDELVPVAPRVLRRYVTSMMSDRFAATAVKESKEMDRYDIVINASALRVLLTFAPSGGHSSHQLDYHVRLPTGTAYVCYEQLWRTPGRWDYLTEANAARSVEHLGRLIATLAELA